MSRIPSDAGFVAHLLELLEPLGGVTAKRMFGGHGIFRNGIMFGLVADGAFYLKADDLNRPEFERLDLPPFRFENKDGRVTVMSYSLCPDNALDSPSAMAPWARSAVDAAERNRKPGRKGKRV